MSRKAMERKVSLRVSEDLWAAALKRADEKGEHLSEAIRAFLRRYVK